MSTSQETPNIPLPKGWTKQVRSAVLHVISLAQYAAAYTRGWAADSTNARVRLKAEWDRANQELLLLREEIRIKDARLARIDPHRRPHYPPTERMAILQLKAARAWSLEQTARVFQLTAATVASWLKRIDEQGPAPWSSSVSRSTSSRTSYATRSSDSRCSVPAWARRSSPRHWPAPDCISGRPRWAACSRRNPHGLQQSRNKRTRRTAW